MKDSKVILYDKYIMYKGQKIYDKDEFFEYLNEERENAKIKNVSLKCKDYYDIYTVRLNKDSVQLVFPYMYEKENHKYENMIEEWYRCDKKRNLRYLKIAALGAAGLIAIHKLAPYADDVFEDIQDKIEDTFENTKFNLGNLDAYFSTQELEEELDAHTGHNEIEGRKQSVQDHKNSYCALGDDLTTKEVFEAIYDYCDEKELGYDVAFAARERYELLLEDNMEDAYEIDLYDIYKESEKVKTFK